MQSLSLAASIPTPQLTDVCIDAEGVAWEDSFGCPGGWSALRQGEALDAAQALWEAKWGREEVAQATEARRNVRRSERLARESTGCT